MASLSNPLKIAGLFLVGAVYLSTSANYLGDWSGDAATYILLGKSLAQGHGCQDPILPGSYPFTKYPFLFPAMLAPVIGFFGIDFLAIRVEVALIALMAAVAWYFYFRERLQTAAGLGLALAFALHPYSVSFITRTLSETPYLLWTGISFWTFNRWKKTGQGTCLATSLACAVLAFFCRSAGVALFGALILGVVLEPQLWSRKVMKIPATLAVVVVSLLAAAGWSFYVLFHPTPVVNYFQEMFQPVFAGRSVNFAVLLERVQANSWYYFSTISSQLLPGLRPGSAPSIIISGLLWLLLAAGAFRAARNRQLLEVFYFAFSIAMVMVWPCYLEFRFLFPLLPLMLMFGYESILLIARAMPSPNSAKAFKYASFALFSGAWLCYTCLVLVSQHRPNPFPPSAQSMFGFSIEKPVIDWSKTFYAYHSPKNLSYLGEFIALNQLAAEIIPPQAVIASAKPSDTALVTGHRCVRLPIAVNPLEAVLYLESWNVDYLIVDRFSPQTDLAITPLLEEHPNLFEKVAGLPGQISPGIYRFRP